MVTDEEWDNLIANMNAEVAENPIVISAPPMIYARCDCNGTPHIMQTTSLHVICATLEGKKITSRVKSLGEMTVRELAFFIDSQEKGWHRQ